MAATKVFYATGRRKSSSARVFLKPGSGKFVVNGLPYNEYLSMGAARAQVEEPFKVIAQEGQFDANITVAGGGPNGQAGAIKMGLARALCAFDGTLRDPLKKAGLLRRDAREVERKKYGLHGARRRPQFSKR